MGDWFTELEKLKATYGPLFKEEARRKVRPISEACFRAEGGRPCRHLRWAGVRRGLRVRKFCRVKHCPLSSQAAGG
jgi:hypothetical protein